MSARKEGAFKLFHLRYVPLFAVYFLIGIFCISLSYMVAAIVIAVALFSLLALTLTKSLGRGVAVILAVVMILGYALASVTLYYRNSVGLSGDLTLSCRAVEVTETGGKYIVIADHVTYDGKGYAGGIELTTDVSVSPGDRITAFGTVEIDELSLENMYTALKYRTGTKYVMTADRCATSPGKAPLATRIRNKLRDTLLLYQGERAGGFTYAMLFGDTDYMDRADKATLRNVGVAHIFAVSGLHVGVLSAAILFLLRKLKAKRWVMILVMLPVLGFYAYLADFTPSILRASIMILLYLIASMIGMRYDDVSSLSFAAIAILLVKPLYLFDMSFVMSFLSLFGIESLEYPLEKFFRKRKMPSVIASSLALSVATSVAVLPVAAMLFGQVSLVGVLLNVLVVPLASLAYILTVIFLPLTLIYSGFGAALSELRYLPLGIAEMGVWANGINVTGAHTFYAWEIILYYMTLGFVGKHSLARKKVKMVAGIIVAAIFTILLFAV